MINSGDKTTHSQIPTDFHIGAKNRKNKNSEPQLTGNAHLNGSPHIIPTTDRWNLHFYMLQFKRMLKKGGHVGQTLVIDILGRKVLLA